MGTKHRSFRGKQIDMDEIRNANQQSVAIGNMKVNARGDEIDDYGNVIRSRDQVTRDVNKTFSKTSKKASIIASFEDDDDEVVELKDDPKVLKAQQTKTTSKSTTSKTESETKDTQSSTTDLDD